jgi:hypothetical protein
MGVPRRELQLFFDDLSSIQVGIWFPIQTKWPPLSQSVAIDV